MVPFHIRATVACAAVLAAALATSGGAFGQTGGASPEAPFEVNPCIGEDAARLRCPDLQMSPPFNLYLQRTRNRRHLLRAANSINSLGAGPAEVHGRRDGRYTMSARQAIYRSDGSRLMVETGARLVFKIVPNYYATTRWYWKFDNAARFELWRLDSAGRRIRRVRTGPKVAYCLRDLSHRFPSRRGSPPRRVYPACSQNFRRSSVVLGTSVGWSDVYPSPYPEQLIDVTGLRGCFDYVHIADPENGIFESNEDNNEAETVVRLPFTGSNRGCRSRPPNEPPPPAQYGY